jgi:hypothetical protein
MLYRCLRERLSANITIAFKLQEKIALPTYIMRLFVTAEEKLDVEC